MLTELPPQCVLSQEKSRFRPLQREYARLFVVETLGHGAYLIIDGLKADKNLTNQAFIASFLKELSKTLEPSGRPKLTMVASQSEVKGVSALLSLDESYLALHTYEAYEALSLRVFSRYKVTPETYTDALKHAFGAKRFLSHLSSHSKTVSANKSRQEKTLLGDRQYTSLRLDKNLMF